MSIKSLEMLNLHLGNSEEQPLYNEQPPCIKRCFEVVSWLLKHEEVIVQHFDVPEGITPTMHLLKLQTIEDQKQPMTYTLPSLYASHISNCRCSALLKVKKLISSTLFDDVLGTCDVSVLTKYCKCCKVTYFPGYFENYTDGFREYYPGWEKYPIFQSTHQTIISTDLMKRLVCLKQKCHTTFIGKADSYNLFHSNTPMNSSRLLDKRRISEAYFLYTYIDFLECYNLHRIVKGFVSDSLKGNVSYTKIFKRNTPLMCALFLDVSHVWLLNGNMKAHRKLCQYKGCSNDPHYKELYCAEHAKERDVIDNQQELLHDDEFHIEKMVKKVVKRGKFNCEVKWQNYEEHTGEPRDNIPRLLVELFELYGDSTIHLHRPNEGILQSLKKKFCFILRDSFAYFIDSSEKDTSGER